MTKFRELGLSKPVVDALTARSFETPTEIQSKAIPEILKAKDLMASAQTGSGKTAAFSLPIIECLEFPDSKPRALILVPTRELAIQVDKEFRTFSKNLGLETVTIYGGTGFNAQIKALEDGVDAIVATPGRLLDLMERGIADLSNIEILVLDEADRMLDMGFMPQVRKIVDSLSSDRQTLMFSATIDDRIERIASAFLTDPVTIRVNSDQVEPAKIDQQIHHVSEFSKDELLAKLLAEDEVQSALVFTRTKRKAGWVKDRLLDANIKAEEIHSDIKQSLREKTLASFRKGDISILVATDVAARGLDIPSVSHVFNYDLPDEPEVYVHRIGRTGRAGRSGIAVSFVSDEQRFLIRDIEKTIGRRLDPNEPVKKSTTQLRGRLLPTKRRRRIV